MNSLTRLLILLALLISPTAFADVPDFTIHQDYTSTRALGMGNAFAAVADDFSAIFYNPAALAFRDDGHLRMFLRAGISDDYLGMIDDIDKAETTQEINDVVVANYGNHFYSRVPTLGAAWVRPKWGLAVLPADFSLDLNINRQVGPAVNVNAYVDTTVAYAHAWKLRPRWMSKKDKLAIGATAKAIHRVYFEDSLFAASLLENSDPFDQDRAGEGMTFDMDIGFLYIPRTPTKGFWKFLKYAKPQYAFVVRNVLDYGFPINFNLLSEDSDEPSKKLQRRFDFGSKFDLPDLWVFDPHLAVDIRDMGHPNWTLMKGLHIGAELYWTMYSWWKGHWSVGLNQGYMTAGFGARFGVFQLDLATWGEEVGTDDTPNESRRYIVEMSLDF